MKTKELHSFIENIKKEYSIDDAHLGFFYHNEHEIYSGHIKANKQGLILYGIELIEASLKIEKQILKEGEIYNFSNDWDAIPSDISISHIEISQKLKSEIEPMKEYKETLKDHLMKFFFAIIKKPPTKAMVVENSAPPV